MFHKIPNFPSTTCVLWRFLWPKFVFGRRSAPDPTGGAHDAPPDALVGWGWGYPLRITHPPRRRRLQRLDLGVPNFISGKLATLGPASQWFGVTFNNRVRVRIRISNYTCIYDEGTCPLPSKFLQNKIVNFCLHCFFLVNELWVLTYNWNKY